jgi:hypothetical protein
MKQSKPNYLNEVDGWYETYDHPQQHFFFKEHSLCGMYTTIPEKAHHDNVPLRHCMNCTKILRKLISVSSMIAGKKLNAGQVMRLLDALEKIKLNKGLAENQQHGESVCALVTSQKTNKTLVIKTDNKSDKLIK